MSRAAAWSQKILRGEPAGRRPMYTALDSGARGALRLEVGDDGWLVVRSVESRAILHTAEIAGMIQWLVEQYGEPVTREIPVICGLCLCPTPPGVAHVQHYHECAHHDPATCHGCAIDRAGEA